MTKIVRNTLRAPEELITALKRIARRKGKTMNGIIVDILWDWLENHATRT